MIVGIVSRKPNFVAFAQSGQRSFLFFLMDLITYKLAFWQFLIFQLAFVAQQTSVCPIGLETSKAGSSRRRSYNAYQVSFMLFNRES